MLLYRSDSDLFRDNYVFVGVNPRINPTSTRLGPAIEIQPLSVLNFRLNVEYVDYFGSLGTVQSFPSALSDFSSATMGRNEAQGKNYGASGLRVSFTAFSQMKVGPVALRDGFTLEYLSIDLRGPDRVFFEPAYDTVVPRHGKVITNDLDLFYLVDMPRGGFFRHGWIAAGVRYTMLKPYFDSVDVRPGEDSATAANDMHRVGPLVAFTLFDDGPSTFHEPMIVAMAQWYAAHRNRTGRDVDQAIPYGVLAFIFQSDVWTSGRDGLSR